MTALRAGIIRYLSVAKAIGAALQVEPTPDCRIGHGRIVLTFRRLGATRWPEERQIEYALHAAGIARGIMSQHRLRSVRQRAERAIVVVYEDAMLSRGCAVTARWECVVPTPIVS